MPRALTWTRTTITHDARGAFLTELRRRREACRAARCNYWVFEDPADAGAFVQFIEAHDADTIDAVRATFGDGASYAAILTEVELT